MGGVEVGEYGTKEGGGLGANGEAGGGMNPASISLSPFPLTMTLPGTLTPGPPLAPKLLLLGEYPPVGTTTALTCTCNPSFRTSDFSIDGELGVVVVDR